MNPARGALARRLGLALAAFSALPFLNSLEDAFVLPQRLALTAAAALLALGAARRWPRGPLAWAVLTYFSWRLFSRVAAEPAGSTAAWLAWQAALAGLFIFAGAALLEAPLRRFLAAALLAAGILVAAFALLQWMGASPFEAGAVDLGFAHRTHGSLGNPDFLGGWLALLLPLAAALALRMDAGERTAAGAAGKTARLPAQASLLLMGAALALTQARASWLAALAGTGLAVLHLRRPWRPWRVAVVVGATAFVVLGAAWGLRRQLPARLAEAVDLRSDAWQSRAFMAACALDLAKEHPWVGVGPGGFSDGFLRRQGERLNAGAGQPYRYTEDAHNDWLQIAAESGWPGLLLWAFAWDWALRAAWRRRGPGGAALAGGLLAFGVQGLFHFPWSIAPSAGLLMLGLAQAAAWESETLPPARLAPAWGWAAALGLSLALGLGLRQAGASACLNAGVSATLQPQTLALAGPLYAKARDLNGGDARAWQRHGAVALAQGRWDEAIDDYQRALLVHPALPEAWVNLGLALAQAGSLPAAQESLDSALALNPRSSEAWINASKLAWLQNRRDDAESLLRRGLREAGESVQAYFNLAALLYNERRYREAAASFRDVLRLQPDHAEARRLLNECLRAS